LDWLHKVEFICEKVSPGRTPLPAPAKTLAWSNFNSLADQLGIYLILAKREKLGSDILANQLDKNRNLAKLTSPPSVFPSRWEGEKRIKE
jgi:hypothetical protein